MSATRSTPGGRVSITGLAVGEIRLGFPRAGI
jgi:hypothetical protein